LVVEKFYGEIYGVCMGCESSLTKVFETGRLFLADAGLPYQDVRYPFDDSWAASASQLRENGISRTGKVPVLEYNNNKLSQVCFDLIRAVDSYLHILAYTDIALPVPRDRWL
jgi:hypothetical protein